MRSATLLAILLGGCAPGLASVADAPPEKPRVTVTYDNTPATTPAKPVENETGSSTCVPSKKDRENGFMWCGELKLPVFHEPPSPCVIMNDRYQPLVAKCANQLASGCGEIIPGTDRRGYRRGQCSQCDAMEDGDAQLTLIGCPPTQKDL